MKRIILITLLILCVVSGAAAQDATPDVSNWQTEVAADAPTINATLTAVADEIVPTETLAPEVTPEAPVIVTVEVPPAPTDNPETLMLVGFLAFIVIAVLHLLFGNSQSRAYKAIVDGAEKHYAAMNESTRTTIDAALNVLDAVKVFIPGTFDDRLVELGRDIQTDEDEDEAAARRPTA
jgi:hypothetical protein